MREGGFGRFLGAVAKGVEGWRSCALPGRSRSSFRIWDRRRRHRGKVAVAGAAGAHFACGATAGGLGHMFVLVFLCVGAGEHLKTNAPMSFTTDIANPAVAILGQAILTQATLG